MYNKVEQIDLYANIFQDSEIESSFLYFAFFDF